MKIGTFFDIDIYISKLFILMMAVALLLGNGREMAIIFLVIFIHELFHVMAARCLQMKVSEIELLPFGGMVKVQSIFELNPRSELIIAVAGPISNVLMIISYIFLKDRGFVLFGDDNFFLNINLVLAGFNLLPALPLDGGRMIRGILSSELGMKKSTQIAAYGGIILAILLIVIGLYSLYYKSVNPTFFITGIFLIYSAIKEKRSATYIVLRDITYKKEALLKEGTMPVREMAVLYDVKLKDVMKKFVPGRYHYVQIVDEELRVKGKLSESQIVKGLIDYGINYPIIRLLGKYR